MGIINYVKNKAANWLPKAAETDCAGNMWYWLWMNEACRTAYSSNNVPVFCEEDSFKIACSLAEVFFPIDAIADRVATLRFDVVDKSGKAVDAPKSVQRLIEQPNPFSSFSDLIYDSVFYELSSGNNWVYTKTPSSIKGLSPDTISSVWALQPDKVSIKQKQTRPSIFDVKSFADLVQEMTYTKYDREFIDPNHVIHERSFGTGGYDGGLLSRSPLAAVVRNINNLLVVYEARYKVYSSNGNAGILTRDSMANRVDEESALMPPVDRDMILNDVLNRNGLTGDKNLWTISAIPLRFIKTLASIKELQPFEETRDDALAIGGIYGVDKDLLPMKEGTTFSNKEQAERGLYQNVVKGVADAKAKTMTKAFALNQLGLSFRPNYNDVEILQEDVKTSLEGDSLLIQNLIRLRDAGLADDSEVREITDKLIEVYKNGQA